MHEEKNMIAFIQELLSQYGFSNVTIEETSVVRGSFSSKTFVIRVPEEDSRFLIGQYGNNLHALQHVVRMLVGKQFPETINAPFFIDVNDYRKKKDQDIIEIARSAAREAVKEGKTITLRPMSSYERRLVHTELSKETGVTTESVGDGEDRRITVQPLHAA